MKRLLLGVFVVICSCTAKKNITSEDRIKQVRDQYLLQMGELVSSSKELLTTIEANSDSIEVRKAFENTRYAFKELETLAEFYNPDFSKRLNGAPVDKVDEGDPERIINATGLQVLEEYIYPSYDAESQSDRIDEARRIVSLAQAFQREIEVLGLSEKNIFEALKVEFLRIVSLGISGFDSPVALNSLEECEYTLEGIRKILEVYYPSVSADLSRTNQESFSEAIKYLKENPNFNDFDRAAFITDHLQPLYKQLFKFQKELGVENNNLPSPVNFDTPQLFGENYYSVGFFAPSTNQYPNEEIRQLGEMLFYDPILSKDNSRSCSSCHLPNKGFSDGLAKSVGLNGSPVRRNAPTIINSGFQQSLFADSRVEALENLVFDVINNQNELHGSIADVSLVLNQDDEYRGKFKEVFGVDSISSKYVQMVLGTYSRSVVGMKSPFDRYMAGDKTQLSEEEIHGFNLYMGKAKCGTCHFAPLFNGTIPPFYTENESEVIGVPTKADTINASIDLDSGRFYTYGGDLNLFAFKIPTVRNAELTAPYMHNGVYQNLEEVMDFYNRGGGAGIGIDLPHQTLPTDPLNLSDDEIKAIIAFLHALTDNPEEEYDAQTASIE